MQAIKLLRASGCSRAEIATALGVTRHTVGHWERGLRFPDGANFSALVDLAKQRGLDLSAEDFVSRSEPA